MVCMFAKRLASVVLSCPFAIKFYALILLRIASNRGFRGLAAEPGLFIPPSVSGIASPNPAGRPAGLGLAPVPVEALASTLAVAGLKLGILRAAILKSFLTVVSLCSLDFLIWRELLL